MSPCGEGEPRRLKTVCVYCGTGEGGDPAYMAAAEELGRMLAAEGLGLVYGGGSLGLMGAVARSALEAGGHVTGVIPAFLEEREVMMQTVSELVVTKDMHERKATMAALADAFRAFDADGEASVAILTGAGGTFCAGADLSELGGANDALAKLPISDAIESLNVSNAAAIALYALATRPDPDRA